MKKNVITTALLAGLVLSAGINAARADDKTQVIVTGSISNSTCDIGAVTGLDTPDGNGGTIALKSAAASRFTANATLVNPKDFSIAFTGCPADATAPTGKVHALRVDGYTIASDDTVFNDQTGNSAGIRLKTGATVLGPGDFAKTTEAASAAATASIPFTVAMIAPNATAVAPVAQNIKATLTFTADYD